jgi:hypothetical protein
MNHQRGQKKACELHDVINGSAKSDLGVVEGINSKQIRSLGLMKATARLCKVMIRVFED